MNHTLLMLNWYIDGLGLWLTGLYYAPRHPPEVAERLWRWWREERPAAKVSIKGLV